MFLRRRTDTSLSDEDLVLRIRGGHQASLAVLWDRYAQLLFGVAMKYLKDVDRSKDAVLDLFTVLPERLAKQEVRQFRSWVHTVMRNHCLMELRKAGVPMDRAIEEMPIAGPPVQEEGPLLEADLQRMEAAIEHLDPDQRACIRLFHLERRSYKQVSEQLDMPVEQVRSHLQNGRRNLRIALDQRQDRHEH